MALADRPINIVISKGARLYKKYLWKDSAGTPIDLTGKKARIQVKESDMSDVVLLTLSTEAGELPDGVITLGLGTIELYVPGTVTEALTWEEGIYDLKIYTTADDADEIFEGRMTVEAGATSVQ
jgi:hypothetical protein